MIDKTRQLRFRAYLESGFLPSKRFWNWNIYSNGFTLSSNIGLGKHKIISVAGDHGHGFETRLMDREISMPSRNHLTWQEWKLGVECKGKTIRLMKHPWIDFIQRENMQVSKKARGTLVFVPHSVPGLATTKFDIEAFVHHSETLENLQSPVSYALHSHDLGQEIHQKMKDMGKSVVSAGDSQHPYFVYNFVKMVQDHRFACSPSFGSQVFLLHHLGLDYFLMPNAEQFERSPLGREVLFPEAEITAGLFSSGNIGSMTEEKDALAGKALGLSGKTLSNREILRLAMGGEVADDFIR